MPLTFADDQVSLVSPNPLPVSQPALNRIKLANCIPDITLITPPLSFPPLRTALDQNPYLTKFYSPSVSVIAPKDLEMTMGTAELLRLPEVQRCITTNFLLLSCDLICDIPGQSILEAWIANQWVLEDNNDSNGVHHASLPTASYFDHQLEARSGALAVYYQTKTEKRVFKKKPLIS
jgi:hypothetical protein